MSKDASNKRDNEYYIGLDIGTGSVGWAVTHPDYTLVEKANGSGKKGKKPLFGVRLFDEGEAAAGRRGFRSARRRLARRRVRLDALEDIFRDALNKKDADFLTRLHESKLYGDDRSLKDGVGAAQTAQTLFNDANFTDKDFHKKFPTIYHLRAHLIRDPEPDIRLVYLGIHHILKARGHFVQEGYSFSDVKTFAPSYEKLCEELNNAYGIDMEFLYNKEDSMETAIKTKDNKTKKKNQLLAILKEEEMLDEEDANSANVRRMILEDLIVPILAGSKLTIKDTKTKKLATIMGISSDEDDEEAKAPAIEFNAKFDEKADELRAALGDKNFALILAAKGVYDFAILDEILAGKEYLSDAMVGKYDAHGRELKALKHLIKTYLGQEAYKEAFTDINPTKATYLAYMGKAGKNKTLIAPDKTNFSKTSIDEMNKYFGALLDKVLNSDKISEADKIKATELKDKCDEVRLLQKQRHNSNGVIPYQVHLEELEKILATQAKAHKLLDEVTGSAHDNPEKLTNAAKVERLHTFRIPYYVGPLNDAFCDKEGYNVWIVKNAGYEHQSITAYNFSAAVDVAASAQKFIARMSSNCTYLKDKKALVKQGLLYSKYEVLQELNNLRINGAPLSRLGRDVKKEIFYELFGKQASVSHKALKSFLEKHYDIKGAEVKGTADPSKFNASLKSYIDFKDMLGMSVKDIDALDAVHKDTIEDIILKISVLPDAKDMLIAEIEKTLTKDAFIKGKLAANGKNASDLAKLKYTGFGRLSKELLTTIKAEVGVESITEHGEVITLDIKKRSIIEALFDTEYNLMQLLSEQYDFNKQIIDYNKKEQTAASKNASGLPKINYDMVESLYVSPSVKRGIYQSLLVVEELVKINGALPAKVFIETTREKQARDSNGKGKRTQSKRDFLEKLYKDTKNAKLIDKSVKEELDESEVLSERIYLYFLQNGKCAYSGARLDINHLSSQCQVEHIYPQSMIKDNSIDNTVLVLAAENQRKLDSYPLDLGIQKRMKSTWKDLKKMNLMSAKKYERLTSTSAADIAGFIARDLVSTSQSVKEVMNLLKGYLGEDTDVITSKAKFASQYRRYLDFPKIRELNNYHHAYDAYLNIVVGNVLNARFTKAPLNFIKDEKARKSISNDIKDIVREWDWNPIEKKKTYKGVRTIERGGLAYDSTLEENVKDTLRRTPSFVSRLSFKQKGGLFDATIYRKASPLKATNASFHIKEGLDIDKYGGYDKLSGSHFCLVRHGGKKGKNQLSIEFVPVVLAGKGVDSKKLESYLANYLNSPEVLVQAIKFNSKMVIDGMPYILLGRSGNTLLIHHALEFRLEPAMQSYLKLVLGVYERICELNKLKNSLELKDDFLSKVMTKERKNGSKKESYQYINTEKNLELYDLYINKLQTAYANLANNQVDKLISKRDIFINLGIEKQLEILNNALNFFKCNKNKSKSDLSPLGLGKHMGQLGINKNIDIEKIVDRKEKDKSFKLINESVTGFYKNVVDLAKL